MLFDWVGDFGLKLFDIPLVIGGLLPDYAWTSDRTT